MHFHAKKNINVKQNRYFSLSLLFEYSCNWTSLRVKIVQMEFLLLKFGNIPLEFQLPITAFDLTRVKIEVIYNNILVHFEKNNKSLQLSLKHCIHTEPLTVYSMFWQQNAIFVLRQINKMNKTEEKSLFLWLFKFFNYSQHWARSQPYVNFNIANIFIYVWCLHELLLLLSWYTNINTIHTRPFRLFTLKLFQ